MFRFLRDTFLGKDRKEAIGEEYEVKLKKSLKANQKILKEIFINDDTIIFRDFQTHHPNSIQCTLVFANGMVDKDMIQESILYPMMRSSMKEVTCRLDQLDSFIHKIITSNEVKITQDINVLIGGVLYGDTLLLIDGMNKAVLIDTKGWKMRSINEPTAEVIVKGPREGFIESILINTSLIRRKIKNPHLKFQFKQIGRRTKTNIGICYIEGLVNEKILKELYQRLDKIDIDGVLGSNYIEELIMDSPFSPFRTMGYTERPDVVAAKLLEGRIAMIIDGTPVVSTLPFVFQENFEINEDYYENFIFASINRLLRFLAFFLSTSTPAIYVALTTYHQEMIPTKLLLSIVAAREGVPFPTIVEALGMILIFEILRETGVRLPQPVGETISIVGALVIGEAAVEAKFVSAPMVIVVALTGISAFLIYKMRGTVIVIRTIFLLLAGFLGLYGYIFGVMGLFIHLMGMRSFGIPYMINMSSFNKQEIKDTIIRAPWWYMYYRPKLIGDRNVIRKKDAKR
ncbi:spore germination protein [Clostridiaceae bacterium 35-E11]